MYNILDDVYYKDKSNNKVRSEIRGIKENSPRVPSNSSINSTGDMYNYDFSYKVDGRWFNERELEYAED